MTKNNFQPGNSITRDREYECTIKNATSAVFTVTTGFGKRCGVSYDRMEINNCIQKWPCSKFSLFEYDF